MTFSLGYYRTRDDSIVELTSNAPPVYTGRLIRSNKKRHPKMKLAWDIYGHCPHLDDLDLMEFLRVQENNFSEKSIHDIS